LPRESLSERKPYHFKSSDGLEIPAYLTLPKGLPVRNLPLVLWPHGGPWGRDSYGYDTFAQFSANRGYAVLQPNFRASTGYGKKFLNAGNGEWGRKMQDDLTWGVKALIADGTVDPRRVGISGGSYGGYAARERLDNHERLRQLNPSRKEARELEGSSNGDAAG
jgi:dipeptidyl aminopeptidase/acylaminoacyl peptidase